MRGMLGSVDSWSCAERSKGPGLSFPGFRRIVQRGTCISTWNSPSCLSVNKPLEMSDGGTAKSKRRLGRAAIALC